MDRLSAIYRTVSDDEQKYGGDLLHIIWILIGIIICVLLMFFSGGNLVKTYEKFHASFGATLIC